MDNCPFCKIIKGEIPAKKIYEDESCAAILDIYPANPGHILLLSKAHTNSFLELDDLDVAKLGMVSKKLSEHLIRLLKPEGISIFFANGEDAGQRAPHFMMHLIPRFQNDGVPLDLKRIEIEVSPIFEQIKPFLKKFFPHMDYEANSDSKKSVYIAPATTPEEKMPEQKIVAPHIVPVGPVVEQKKVPIVKRGAKVYQYEISLPNEIVEIIPEDSYPYFSKKNKTLVLSDVDHPEYKKDKAEKLLKKIEKEEKKRKILEKKGEQKAKKEIIDSLNNTDVSKLTSKTKVKKIVTGSKKVKKTISKKRMTGVEAKLEELK